jgi:hypothetical protein
LTFPPTPEEITAYEKRERRLAKNRERARMRRNRKKIPEQYEKDTLKTLAAM